MNDRETEGTRTPQKDRESDRTLGNRPGDPNAANQKVRVPPGVDADEVWDPGSQSPDAPPVDNRT